MLKKFWEKRLSEETQTLKELREQKSNASGDKLEKIKSKIAHHAGEKIAAQNALESFK